MATEYPSAKRAVGACKAPAYKHVEVRGPLRPLTSTSMPLAGGARPERTTPLRPFLLQGRKLWLRSAARVCYCTTILRSIVLHEMGPRSTVRRLDGRTADAQVIVLQGQSY